MRLPSKKDLSAQFSQQKPGLIRLSSSSVCLSINLIMCGAGPKGDNENMNPLQFLQLSKNNNNRTDEKTLDAPMNACNSLTATQSWTLSKSIDSCLFKGWVVGSVVPLFHHLKQLDLGRDRGSGTSRLGLASSSVACHSSTSLRRTVGVVVLEIRGLHQVEAEAVQ